MIYKKVTRFIMTSLIVVFAVFSSIPPAKADTIQAHGTVSTSYGSYTWSAQQAASTLPITIALPYVGLSFAYNSGTSFSIDYSLKNQYSGVVTITVTGNNTWSVDNVNILTSGCNLDSLPSDHASYKTSHSFTLRLKNSDKFSFVIYGAGATVFLGSTSVSVSHNMSVDNLEQQIDSTLDLYLPGMSNSLSGLGYDSNTSTSLSADTLAYDISIIKNYIDGIEGYLSTGNSYIDQLEGYVDGLETSLNNIVSLLHYNIDPDAYPMYFLGALDGYIDTSYNWVQTVDGIAPTLHITSQRTTYNQSFNVEIQPQQSLYMIYYSNYPSNQFYYLTSGGTRLDGTVTTLQSINGFRLFLVEFKNTVSSNNIYPSLCNSFPTTRNNSFIPLYMGYHIPSDLADRFNLEIDNTYTRLLQGIINAVGSISQQQIIENNTNINNYNNYQTQINNVENNYYNEYNTYNTDIQNNNTFDFSGLSSDGVTVYQNLFTSVFQIDLIKWPLLIILLGLIVVIILG